MIETFLISYLINKTSVGINVFAERPETPPEEYILIEKTGSSRENTINISTIAIQSISNSSMLNAMSLNEEVKDAILGDEDYGIIESDNIIGVELNSDYNFTDNTTKEYRYQAIFAITHY